MRTVNVVPGTILKGLIEGGAPVAEIASEVKRSAEASGLRGEVGFLIEIPEVRLGTVEDVPTSFKDVA